MIRISRDKLFRIGKQLFFDVRDYELNHAVKMKQDLYLVHIPTNERMHVPLKDINRTNFMSIGKNKTKRYPVSFDEERFNVKKGDVYKLYSIKWSPNV